MWLGSSEAEYAGGKSFAYSPDGFECEPRLLKLIYLRLFVSALLSSAKFLFARTNLIGNQPIIRGLG